MVTGPLRGPGSSIPLVILRTSSLIKTIENPSGDSLKKIETKYIMIQNVHH